MLAPTATGPLMRR